MVWLPFNIRRDPNVDSMGLVVSNSATSKKLTENPDVRIVALTDTSPNKDPYGKSRIGQRRSSWKPISVVIPAHNEASELPETLDYLFQSINQLGIDAQVVVANDASTDNTREIAIVAGCHVVDVELRNIGAVRNAGAREASAEWIFFLDADTRLPARTLAKAMDMLASGFAGGGAHVAIPDQPKVALLKLLLFYAVRLFWQSVAGKAAGCFMFCRKEIFHDFGGFDEKVFAAEEWFFSVQVSRRGKFGLVRHSVITSARKLHKYSTLALLRFVTVPILTTEPLLQSRRGLDILYDDDR